MKKLLILSIVVIWSMVSFGQTHRTFVSASAGWTPAKDLTYSIESGRWGTTSPTSLSVTLDFTRNTGSGPDCYNAWLGAKAYYTFYEHKEVVYMFYLAPKFQLQGDGNNLLEFGVNPNYNLSDNLLLGVTVGNQVLESSQWNMFWSVGIVYLL